VCALLACALALVAAPVALAAPGDVYVADRDAGPAGTGAVIKVDPASGAQQVVASGGSLVDPTGIAVDIRGFPGHDTLLVADPEALGGTGALFRVDPENGNVQVISSGDRFVDPTGVTGFLTVSDPSATPSNPNLGDGDVFFVESGNGVQHPILSGFSLSPSIDLVDPTGLALSASGALLIADPEAAGGAGAVFLLTEPIRTLGSFFSAYAQGGSLSDPTGLAEVPTGVLGHGFIAVADRSAAGTGAVLSLTGGASGGAVQQVLSSGGSFAAPVALAYSPFAGGPLLVADRAAAGGGGALLSVNPASGAQTVLSSGGSFVEPSGVAVSPPLCDGNRADVAGSEGADVIPGSNSSDTVAALGGDDDVDGGESDDLVCAGDGNDEVRGDSGDPLIFGADVLFGEEGDDVLTGNRYPDVLDGGPGDDVLRGRGGGKDRLKCGPGRDKATADRKDRVRGCERVKRSKK
jgi:Ca2+-binding RTX toxin-like protein